MKARETTLRRAAAREDGQVVAFLAVGLLALLLGVAAIVIDVGRAYVLKRQLQGAADAAALAAADSLPTAADARAAAALYGPGGRNPAPLADTPPAQSVGVLCLRGVAYCYGHDPGTTLDQQDPTAQANGVAVTESAYLKTTFASVLGLDTIHVTARATACGGCGAQKLDIALVVDRTGSMAGDMTQLKLGVASFLKSLDPRLDQVALFALPPSPSSNVCDGNFDPWARFPFDSGAAYGRGSESRYLVSGFSTDYLTSTGAINTSSQLVRNLTCLKSGGSTAYEQALMVAHDYLAQNGRAGVQKVIVFESDGAANMAPDAWYDSGSGHSEQVVSYGGNPNGTTEKQTVYNAASGHEDDVARPCTSAVNYANSIKQPTPTDPHGYLVFTLYFRNDDNTCFPSPHRGGIGYRDPQAPEGTAAAALTAMASPKGAFSEDDPNQLSDAFGALANKVLGATLVADESP